MTNAVHWFEMPGISAPFSDVESRGHGFSSAAASGVANFADLSPARLFHGLDRTPGCEPFVNRMANCLEFVLVNPRGALISVGLAIDECYSLRSNDQANSQENIVQPAAAESAARFFMRGNIPQGETQNIERPVLGYLVAVHAIGALVITAETDNSGTQPATITPEMLVDFAHSDVAPEDAAARLQLVDPPFLPPDEAMYRYGYPS